MALLDCCSMIGYVPPFLSELMRGDIDMPQSPDAASLAIVLIIVANSFSIFPNHPAVIGITCPRKKWPYAVSNGPMAPFSPLPTTSSANTMSSF